MPVESPLMEETPTPSGDVPVLTKATVDEPTMNSRDTPITLKLAAIIALVDTVS
jgi:hypothetical protein